MYQRFTSSLMTWEAFKDLMYVTISFLSCVKTTLSAIFCNTSPTFNSLSPVLLSNDTKQNSGGASKGNGRFSLVDNFLMDSKKVLHKSVIFKLSL